MAKPEALPHDHVNGISLSTAPKRMALAFERSLSLVCQGAAAFLVLAEVVILFTGVIARYVFRAPLVWSEQTASMLFLWLAMLGAVIALQRGEHMRMTAFTGIAGPKIQALLEIMATTAALTFLVLIWESAFEYAQDEVFIINPALDISNVWRAAAMPTGIGLMAVMAALKLFHVHDWRMVAISLGIAIAACAALAASEGTLRGLGNLNLLVFFVGVVAICVFAGIPIAFSFGLATFGYLALTTRAPLLVLVSRMDEGMSHIVLLSVPLFVLLGVLTEMTGMARAMIGFLATLLGHVRGGLSYVLVGAMYLVSGISGSKAADMAALAPVLFPEMRERGAKPGELVALLSASGAQTETIPPSLVLITVGSVTGVSIGALFTGGLLPGVVVGLMLCAVVWWRSRGDDTSVAPRATIGEIGRTFIIALPALALPFVIRFSVVEGVATATEVSTIGIAYAVLAGLLIYRRFDWRRIWPMLVSTAALSGAILLIIGSATSMAWCLTQSGFSATLAAVAAAMPGGAVSFIIVSMLAFIVLGSLLEGIPAIVLFAPLLFPIAKQVGIHEVHYAMIAILAMGIGLFAPPFGVGYYTACAISRINPDLGMWPIVGYLVALLIGLIVVAAVPWISIGFLG